MKKLLFISFSVFLLMTTNSCIVENSPKDEKLYYQFTQSEWSKTLVSYDIGKEFVYKNQDNQQLIFKVITSETGKTGKYSGGGMGFFNSSPSLDFYYDRQEIVLQCNIGNSTFDFPIYINKYPTFINETVYPEVYANPKFTGYLNFPFWNGYTGSDTSANYAVIDFARTTFSMDVNGKNYSKVLTFESYKSTTIGQRSVHKIYYDMNAGVIGFDDLDGKEWRIQN